MREHDDVELEPALERLLRGPAALVRDDEAGELPPARQVVARFRAQQSRQRAVVASSALALAAAVALGIGVRWSVPRGEATSVGAVPRLSHFSLQTGHASSSRGRVYAPDDALEVGRTLLEPGACVTGAGGRACAVIAAAVELPGAEQPQEMALLRGQISARALADESGFSVRTLQGQVVIVRSALVMIDEHGVMPNAAANVEAPRALTGAAPAVPLEHAPSRADAAPTARPAPSALLAGDLLELARQERARRHYSEAARAYRKLEQTFPDSAEARAALVSLGQLQLGQLGQPEAALRSFQAYLSAPGQLAQEAEHGAILALQKLGRKPEERRAIESFLARYPKSVQAEALKQRLQQL